MASQLPSIILVHGAWHQKGNYKSFTDALATAGFPVYTPQLPSCSNDYTVPNIISFPEDVAAVNTIVRERVEAGENVLMIMHSYGGLVGTEAITDELLRSKRLARGHSGGVIHLLYLCAYMVAPGTSVIDISKAAGFYPLWDNYITNMPDGSTFPIDPALMFFSGEGDPSVVAEALQLLVRTPLSAFHAFGKGDAWKKAPVSYVHTLKDYGVPHAYQTIMVDRVETEGIQVQKYTYDATHSIFITEQKAMVDLALRAANDSRNLE